MSEARNPITENLGVEEETTPVELPVVSIADEADAVSNEPANETAMAAEATSDEVVEATAVAAAMQPAPVPTPAAPVTQPPAQPPAPVPTQTAGPKEYAPEYEVGGRSRRINIEVRLDEVNYKNVALLGRFLDPRGRILSRRKTRVSAKVQRRVVNAIKLARHIALLPYTSDQTRVVRRRR